MSEEGQFWVSVWKVAGATFVGLATVVAGCQSYQTASVKEMVKNGADPLRAACAVNHSDTSARCAVLAVSKGN